MPTRPKTPGLLFYFPQPGGQEPIPVSVPDVGHPGFAESLIPVWGSGREAIADAHDGDWVGAAVNTGLAISDVVPVKAFAGMAAKGGFKVAPKVWKTARKALVEEGFAAKGQPLHHWAIPQNGWGKNIPGELKNMKWNLNPMQNAEVHGRIHGPYLGKPQFNPFQQFFQGTPAGVKAAGAVGAAHGVNAGVEDLRKPKPK